MHQIEIDYLPEAEPRYGYGRPVHRLLCDLLDRRRSEYKELLSKFPQFADDFKGIPLEAVSDPLVPYWNNGFLPSLDIVALHCLLCLRRPKRYLEIGSGNSTRVAARAKRLHSLPTKIISIDPSPRIEVDSLCDELYRSPLEQLDIEVCRRLQPGDFLFIDSGHRVLMNSDVTALFLDVLPALPAGVMVHIHDVFWPSDYPPTWADRYYSEQYLLACCLLYGDRFRVNLPNFFIVSDPELSQVLKPLWVNVPIPLSPHGGSFWVTTR
jgi:hypothetical protein